MEQHPKVLGEFTGDIKRLIRKFENVSRTLENRIYRYYSTKYERIQNAEIHFI